MATTTKKGAKNKKAKLRSPVVKTSVAEQAQTIAELRQELQDCKRQLTEAWEQQNTTGEILRVIASSPADLQNVLDTIAENAARLCDADDVLVRQTDGVTYQTVAHFGPIPYSGDEIPVEIGSGPGRAILERRIVHVHDVQKADNEFLGAKLYGIPGGIRTALAVPLMRDGVVIGIFHLRRLRVQPFTDNQIKLLKTFADQAVIAIENVRLFQELKESLEQQTATSEILGVIARSPTEIQPVLDAVAQRAARLCESTDALIHRINGNVTHLVASYGPIPQINRREELPIDQASVQGRAIYEGRTVHVHDLAAVVDTQFPGSKILQQRRGTRTILCTPLMRKGVPIGFILMRRLEVRPFSDKQIKTARNLRSSSRYRHRECAVVQRTGGTQYRIA